MIRGSSYHDPMVSSDGIYFVRMLDKIDITRDVNEEKDKLQGQLPNLKRELQVAMDWVAGALAPVPPWHPADDTWDDQIFFVRAMNESKYVARQEAYEEAERKLIELVNSDDPATELAGAILVRACRHLKSIGLKTRDQRDCSQPSIDGLTVANIVWQARNQDQHWNDGENLHNQIVEVFRALTQRHPEKFGLQTAPSSNEALQMLLREQSWARSVLLILGWTSADSARAGIAAIRPSP